MLTTAQIAQTLKVTPRRVLAIAKARGVVPLHKVGSACWWAHTATEAMKPGKVGRPRKSTGV